MPALLLLLAGCVDPPPPGIAPADSATDTAAPPGDCDALTAHATTSRATGRVPFTPTLDGTTSCGPDAIVAWTWALGGTTLDGATVTWTGLAAGTYEATLTVTDSAGNSANDTVDLEVVAAECPEVLEPVTLGAVADAELVEASGLVTGRRDPAVLWSHNDSGDTARLFALGRDGTALGTWTLDVMADDWEDLAWGTDPDSGEPLLFVGDIGNNELGRETLTVYVLAEPTVDTEAAASATAVSSWTTLTLRLPEPLTADTLLVDPVTGDLVVVSDAEDGRAVLLVKPAPHVDGEDVTLEDAGELTFGAGVLPGDTVVTGGDVSPLGDRVVLRTRSEAWLWLRDGGSTLAEALQQEPCAVPLATESAGESVTFDTRDGGVITTSEGAGAPIIWVPFEEVPECFDAIVPTIVADPAEGPLPLEVTLDASTSCVPAGIADATWEIEGAVEAALSGEVVSATWLASGTWTLTLTLTDTLGETATTSTTIVVESGDCPTTEEAETLGSVADEDLVEISGVVVSRRDSDVLWVHNDSGDDPRLFAIDRTGATLGVWDLDVDRGDLEDLAIGYGADGEPEIWMGDIGDNGEDETAITLYRFDEPEVVDGDTTAEHTITEIDSLTVTYPDGARNCETLMVDPVTGDLYLVTKDYDGLSDVYRKAAPHTDGEEAELEHVTSLTFGEDPLEGGKPTTGGEFSPDGAWIVVRTYDDTAYVWRRDRSGTVDDAFATDPCPVELPTEPQGEAICFDADGAALLTISEGDNQPIYRVPLVR